MTRQEGSIVQCVSCGTKNRISADKTGEPKCGKCGETLPAPAPYILRCAACKSRNRIPPGRIDKEAKCGKCGDSLQIDKLFADQPFMVTEANFEAEILKSPLPAMMYAWAPWCPTCKTAMPVIDEFAKDAKGKIRVGKLNVDGAPTLSSTYNILSVPQILVFDGGQFKESLPGALPKHEIMMKMAGYV